jgi:hypothetical protein
MSIIRKQMLMVVHTLIREFLQHPQKMWEAADS